MLPIFLRCWMWLSNCSQIGVHEWLMLRSRLAVRFRPFGPLGHGTSEQSHRSGRVADPVDEDDRQSMANKSNIWGYGQQGLSFFSPCGNTQVKAETQNNTTWDDAMRLARRYAWLCIQHHDCIKTSATRTVYRLLDFPNLLLQFAF